MSSNSNNQSWFSTLIGIVAILFFGFLIYQLVVISFTFLKAVNWGEIDPTVIAAVITATLGVLASVLAVLISNNLSKKREIEFQNRTKKSEAYSQFLNDVIEVMSNDKDEAEKQKIYKRIAKEFGRDIVLWGSDKMIKSYRDFRELGKTGEQDGSKTLFALENVLFTIRKDLGHKNKGIEPGTLLTFFVTESIEQLRKLDK